VGVTNLPTLRESRPRVLGKALKQFGVICSELFFMFLRGFILGVVIPLDFAHLNDFITSHSLYRIQDLCDVLELHPPWMRDFLDPVPRGGGDAQVFQQSLKTAGGD
jgi:hypothetical protein